MSYLCLFKRTCPTVHGPVLSWTFKSTLHQYPQNLEPSPHDVTLFCNSTGMTNFNRQDAKFPRLSLKYSRGRHTLLEYKLRISCLIKTDTSIMTTCHHGDVYTIVRTTASGRTTGRAVVTITVIASRMQLLNSLDAPSSPHSPSLEGSRSASSSRDS